MINSGLKGLWKQAFYKCEKLENLALPSSVEKINEYVFEDCKSLKWVMIPPSVKTMAWYNDITYLNEDTIFVNVSSDFAIKGSTGSFAEAYAKKFSIPFVSVGVTEKTTFKITFDKNAKDAKLASKDKTKTVKKWKVSMVNFRLRPGRITIFLAGIRLLRMGVRRLPQKQI